MYNFSKGKDIENVKTSITYFNKLIEEKKKKEELDKRYIHWSSSLDTYFNKQKKIKFENSAMTVGMYRPFIRENLYFGSNFIHRTGQFAEIFRHKNRVIIITGVGANKEFSTFITENIADYQTMSNCQAFPMYFFEKQKNYNLFTEDDYEKIDGISDYFKNRVKRQYKKDIAKEDIFYYVYGILNSKDYKKHFSADLKKSLPRIPIVDAYEDFIKFSDSGHKLAELHINYENISPFPNVQIKKSNDAPNDNSLYEVKKMRFEKVGRVANKHTIIYNEYLIITNIPDKAYEYVVNGKSAIEWIMERYAITTDKDSGIENDPNDWSKEHGNPSYIFDLLLSVINVSVQTVNIVNSLPKLKFD